MKNIVLPLPGHAVIYPQNAIGEFYSELLSRDELGLDCFQHKNAQYSLSGAYRRVVAYAEDLHHAIVPYSSPTEQLLDTDRNELWKIYEQALQQDNDEEKIADELGGEDAVKPDEEESRSEMRALVLTFKLRSSSYATMMLRELMRCDTSTMMQKMMGRQSRRPAAPDVFKRGSYQIKVEK